MTEMSHPEATAKGSSQASVSESREASATRDEAYSDERAVYEVGFHVVSTVAEGEAGAVADKIRAEIKKNDAEIITERAPQKITLAYTVERPVSGGVKEKHGSAYFGSIKFATEPEHIQALQGMLRGMKEVLRFIVVETMREEIIATPRRAVFSSDRLEGKTIEKRPGALEKSGQVSALVASEKLTLWDAVLLVKLRGE